MGSDALFCCAYRQSTHIHTIYKGILKRRKNPTRWKYPHRHTKLCLLLDFKSSHVNGKPCSISFLYSMGWQPSPFCLSSGNPAPTSSTLDEHPYEVSSLWFLFLLVAEVFLLASPSHPSVSGSGKGFHCCQNLWAFSSTMYSHQVLCLWEINCVSYTSIQSQRYSKTVETTQCNALCPLRPSALQLPVLSPQISHLNPHTRLLMRVLCYLTHGRTWKGKWANAGRREEGEHKGRCIIITCSFHSKHALLWGKQALVLWSTSVTSMTQRIQECSKLSRSFFTRKHLIRDQTNKELQETRSTEVPSWVSTVHIRSGYITYWL